MGKWKYKMRSYLWKLLGARDMAADIKNLKTQVETLQFFLNTLHEAREVPPTDDIDLRVLQLCDTQLLIIIDRLCKKYQLDYWLDYGTLLGAYRHGGFIPWDDDTDITMKRSDYLRIASIIESDLGQYGINAVESEGRIGVGYMHKETGIWVDIFALDNFKSSNDYYTEENNLHMIVEDYRRAQNIKGEKISFRDLASIIKEKLEKRDIENSWQSYFYRSPGYYGPEFIYKEEDIFPLSKLTFEGYPFRVPNRTETCLKQYYLDYMSFPKTGVLHHNKRESLCTRAKEHNVDMNVVLEQLKEIGNTI